MILTFLVIIIKAFSFNKNVAKIVFFHLRPVAGTPLLVGVPHGHFWTRGPDIAPTAFSAPQGLFL